MPFSGSQGLRAKEMPCNEDGVCRKNIGTKKNRPKSQHIDFQAVVGFVVTPPGLLCAKRDEKE